MIAHWTVVNATLRKYVCACGVVGQARPGRRGIIPFVCQQLVGVERRHCGQPATHVTGMRSQSKCAEHAPTNAAQRSA